MGAARSCDLRVDVGADHRCAVQHVTPPQEVQLITNSTSAQEPRAVVPVR